MRLRRKRAEPEPTLYGPRRNAPVTVVVRVLDIGADWTCINIGCPGTVGHTVTLSEDQAFTFQVVGYSFGGQ